MATQYDYVQIRDAYQADPGLQPKGTSWKGSEIKRIDDPKADTYRVTFRSGTQMILEGYEFISVPQEKAYA